MILFRISKSAFAGDLTGKGAEKAGGRWNSAGTPMIYTCPSRSLCVLEVAVHTPLGNIPSEYSLTIFELPDSLSLTEHDPSRLPAHWNSFPHPHFTQVIGDTFIKQNKFLVMKVPAAVAEGDFNYLINPLHKDMKQVKIKTIEPFNFDTRLFNKK